MKDNRKIFEEKIGFKLGGALLVLDENGIVVHFCGYENPPTQADVDSLYLELSMDKEFGLTEVVETLRIVEPNEEKLNLYFESFNSDDDGVVITTHDEENEII